MEKEKLCAHLLLLQKKQYQCLKPNEYSFQGTVFLKNQALKTVKESAIRSEIDLEIGRHEAVFHFSQDGQSLPIFHPKDRISALREDLNPNVKVVKREPYTIKKMTFLKRVLS